ncbi:MAG: peptidoglycan editing factor PgeF [Methanobacteriota archaeon]|nr:MAG: peptidoglycan editing factor PgeF [Euryarchaeota archaeon]
MPIHIKNYLTYYSFSSLDNLSIVHGIFMRHGGFSKSPWKGLNMATSVGDSRDNVIENRNRILNCLGLKKDSIFDVWQVHSKKVIISQKPRNINTPHEKADAIITSNPQVSLMMLFADCVPILMYDPENQVCALVHAGWKGTVKNIAGASIDVLQKEFSSDPGAIIACIGPSICGKHYEVGRDVVGAAEKEFEENDLVIKENDGKYFMDLHAANYQNLQKAGVEHIQVANICTAENTEDWYSHRGESGEAGRFAVVLTINKR